MFKLCIKYSLVTSAVFITTWDNFFYFSRVDGSSMQPLINSGGQKNFVFIVRPFSMKGIFNRPPMEDIVKRGDVVSVISPKNPKECFLKRIVGMPGDLVKTIHYKKKYVIVPEGHCWIEGDNFKSSYDSNAFGCVPLALVAGQAKFIVFPNISLIKSDLPGHRKLKKLATNNEPNYLIDLKQANNRSLNDNVDADNDEDEDEEDDDDEDDYIDDNNDNKI